MFTPIAVVGEPGEDPDAALRAHVMDVAPDEAVKASYEVKPGDVLELTFGERVTRVKVLSVQEIVGKADAAGMYEQIR